MKKELIILAIFIMPAVAYALCPIENGETVCTLPEFREKIKQTTQINSSLGGMSQPNVELEPIKRDDPMNNMRNPNNTLNYKSGCQFGVCPQEPVTRSKMLNE